MGKEVVMMGVWRWGKWRVGELVGEGEGEVVGEVSKFSIVVVGEGCVG